MKDNTNTMPEQTETVCFNDYLKLIADRKYLKELQFEIQNAKNLIIAIDNFIDMGNMNASPSTQELKDESDSIIKNNRKVIDSIELINQYDFLDKYMKTDNGIKFLQKHADTKISLNYDCTCKVEKRVYANDHLEGTDLHSCDHGEEGADFLHLQFCPSCKENYIIQDGV
tara:strand:- start:121 stop:630 length:510 start_codon:yes stop_codon:yes gene_type:complete